MKVILSLLCILISYSTFSQVDTDFKIPETWEKDFTITLSYHGSMRGGKTDLKITFDSCTYFVQDDYTKKPKLKKYAMKEVDRIAILKKLTELKADQMKSEAKIYAVKDGWSQSICLGTHCVEGGTSVEMHEESKFIFLEVYEYAEEFARKRAR